VASDDELERRVAGEALDYGSQLSEPRGAVRGGSSDDGGDVLRVSSSQPGDSARRTRRKAVGEQSLRAYEHSEAFEQVRLHLLERGVRDLQSGQVRHLLAEALDHLERDRIAARGLELVEIEGDGRASGGRTPEVLEESLGIEPEVRRADHGDSVDPESRRVLGERDRVCGRLSAAVNRDLQSPRGRREKELGHTLSFRDREQDPLTGRPEGQDAVQAPVSEEVDVRAEDVLVQGGAVLPEGGQCRGERALDHRANLKLPAMSALTIERDGPVLKVTLSRPERRNAFDAALIAEVTEAFTDVADARAVVLAGEGESFCAGADVEWQRSSIDLTYEQNVEDALHLFRMCETIDRCPAPVVVQVHGYALGGGSGLVACADVAVAAEDALFGFTEVRLGIIPAVISPFVLAKIGPGAARRWFLTGERFGAEVALRIGLVHEVAPDPAESVATIVDAILAGGPEAVREAKRLVRERPAGPEAADIAAARRTSEEGQAGLRAFLEKRTPPWRSASSS
jgi:methylglutaconyl-CoA hydratase